MDNNFEFAAIFIVGGDADGILYGKTHIRENDVNDYQKTNCIYSYIVLALV